MKQLYKVFYFGGESRINPGKGVDFMIATVENNDGDEYELYAEIAPDELFDKNGAPAMLQPDEENGYEVGWNPDCPNAECLSIPYLINAMRAMCNEIGVDPACLDFDGYDDPEWPQYMLPGVEAYHRIS
jgi:hypothetical protein